MRRRRVTIQGMGRPALVRDVVTSTLSLSLAPGPTARRAQLTREVDPILDARGARLRTHR